MRLLRRDADGRIRAPNIKNVGIESNLYTAEVDGVADDFIEKELSQLEGSAGGAATRAG